MTYERIHFDDNVVKKMTRKQWLMVGGIGNTLNQEKLGEVYDLITSTQVKKNPTNADDSKHVKGSDPTGPGK